jgi:hypothetical protein
VVIMIFGFTCLLSGAEITTKPQPKAGAVNGTC